jgi:hypothetical protein
MKGMKRSVLHVLTGWAITSLGPFVLVIFSPAEMGSASTVSTVLLIGISAMSAVVLSRRRSELATRPHCGDDTRELRGSEWRLLPGIERVPAGLREIFFPATVVLAAIVIIGALTRWGNAVQSLALCKRRRKGDGPL